MYFSYQRSDYGYYEQMNTQISVQFDSTDEWKYKCVDLMDSIPQNIVGSNYQLLWLSVAGESANSVYYIDTVHIGRAVTALDPSVIMQRSPPALGSSGHFFSSIYVRKQASASQISYEITATPYYCGFGIPLLEIAFLEKMPNSTEDILVQRQDNATVTISRVHKASPPLTGTFDVEIYGRRVEGKHDGYRYYIEVVVQGYYYYYYYYQASVDVGFFKDISPFTAQQTTEAVQEKQQIIASYDVFPERQEVSFEGWTPVSAVQDVQTLRISSDCFSMGFCDSTFYFLAYGDHRTGPIPVSASALELQNALNELRGIQPDTVTVTKEELSTEALYNVTFNSNRGDFEDLQYLTMGSDVNITVTEEVKGKASLENFTLLWGGVPSPPLTYDASETEVLDAINVMISAKCPEQIPTTENTNVKYFRDYEDSGEYYRYRVSDSEAFCGRWSLKNPYYIFYNYETQYNPVPLQTYNTLCLAYKGCLANELGMYFSYQRSDYGYYEQMNTQISVQFDSTDEWKYKCVDLMDSIPQNIVGSNYQLLWLSVAGESANSVYYIDTVHIGRAVTALDPSVIMQRSPPALGSSGHFFSSIYVRKQASASQISYEITATPYYCGFGIPLLEIAFLEKMPNSTEDILVQRQDNATVTISRVHKASPPLTGTFDVEIYGRRVEGLPVNISDVDLQYALQGIPELGQLEVHRNGDCRGYTWDIHWLTVPGNQPLLEINSSAVVGVNPSVTSHEIKQGGIFKHRITGDFLRIPTDKPQVEVFINGIPSWCSGDCSFTWSESKTPTMTGVSPTEGSSGLATVLNITGSGFDGGSVTVKTGDVECSVQEVSSTYITCRVGPASAGTHPVSLSFSGLGNARYQNGTSFNFTHLLGVTSIYPTTGSTAGGEILTVFGYGFSINTAVTIGTQPCNVTEAEFTQLKCRVPAGSAGQQTVTVTMGEMSATSTESFTYNNILMATITAVSPHTTTVFVNNVGTAIMTMPNENDRRFVVLPVVDSVSPSVGSTTGYTRLSISGSGFVNASVMVANVQCNVVSMNYSQIVCDTSPSSARRGNVTVYVNTISSSCSSECMFEYSQSVTPVVSSVSPDSVTGNSTTVVVTGSGFGNNKADLRVSADDNILEVTQVTDNIITLLVGALPAGQHALWVVVMSKGLATGLLTLTSTPQATIQPTSGSIAGGTPLLIEGNGFVVDNTTVMLDYVPCQILEVTPDRVKCLTPPHAEGEVQVDIWVYDVEYPQQSFYYTIKQTPDIISVSPATGPVGTQINISGSGFGTEAALVSVDIDAVGCNVTSISDIQLMCTVGEHAGGTFPVMLYHQVKGHALSQSVFSYELLLTRVTPNEGSYAGGAVVAIQGSGFDPNTTRVLICDRECNVDLQNSTSNQLYCEVPYNNGNETEQVCMVSVMNGNDTVSITAGYTYRSSLTPVITDVTPRRGGTAGGTRLTITGSGFSALAAGFSAVRVAVFYSSPQRLDVYVNNKLVAPTNAQWNAGNTEYTALEPTYPGQYLPSFNSTHASNFFDPDYKMLYILLRGSEPLQIRTSPLLVVAFNLPAMTEAEFFGANLIRNLAAFLKVPQNMIRITKIVRAGGGARRRRSTGLTVEIEISLPPVQTFSTNTTNNMNSTDSTNNTTGTTEDDQQFLILKNVADELGRAAVSGNLSQSIGFNVSSLEMIPPPPSSSDPSWSQAATQEVTREDQQMESVRTVSSLVMVVQPVAALYPGPLSVQPSIMALDSEGNCVSVGVTSLTISAVLKDANGNPAQGLSGNTTILFSGCWANYTDLSILTSGGNFMLAFTLNKWNAQSRSFTVRAVTTPSEHPDTTTTGRPGVVPTDCIFFCIFDSSPSITSPSVCLLMLLTALLLLFRQT
ncbi:fibrocystin-L-like [Triplophysa rosa]|uniref:fibrocystin-L-like n=1 Tax=Triplophysa rosa TaxID=992332 RepID=UPI002545E1E4|nr:fibrocystin-L-like [Triplophysa rosa]